MKQTSRSDSDQTEVNNREQEINIQMKKLENRFKLWGTDTGLKLDDDSLASRISEAHESMTTSIIKFNLGVPVIVILTKTNDLDIREVCEERIDEIFYLNALK